MRTAISPGVEKDWHGGRMNLLICYPIDTLAFVDDRFHAIKFERP